MSLRGTRVRVALAVLALEGLSGCSEKPKLEGADPAVLNSLAAEVDQDRLMGTLTELLAAHRADTPIDCSSMRGDLFPNLCHLSNAQASALMQDRFQALGLKVYLQDTADPRVPTANIIAELPGVTHPEEVVLVGAHFDAFWEGADDNTSGAAAVLELARVLSQHRFDRTLRFVGFDLEELIGLGSSRYVHTIEGEQLKLAVIYDCIGFYSSKPGSQLSLPGLPSPSRGDFLAVIANDVSQPRAAELYTLNDSLGIMNLVPIISPGEGSSATLGNLLRSDHSSFWFAGRPALFLTDTANFRNPNYHQPTDTLETLDPASYTKAVRLSAASLAWWAGGPR